MAKTKEQKQQEAIDRNRRRLHQHRAMYLESSPGGEMYKHNFVIYGKEEAQSEARRYDLLFTKACQAAHVDRHGNPIDLSWQRLRDQVVEIAFADSSDAWKKAVVDSNEKMFVQSSDEKQFVVEYANWYEWTHAQNRMGSHLHQFDHKVIFSEGEYRHPTEWRKID